MIELPNNLIGVSSSSSGCSITIVDPIKYTIIKEIKEQDYIIACSSLCVLNANSLIYVYEGKLLQVSIGDDYKILYKTNTEKQLGGFGGIISIEGGKYLAIRNKSNGLSIIKPYY